MIVNPASGRGRGERMLPAIRSAFGAAGVDAVFVTSRAGEEREVATRALASGFTTLVAAGGDGTCASVANVILQNGSDARLGVIPVGTGNDFAKTLGTTHASFNEVARMAVAQSDTRIDVGKIEDTFFLNSCGFGFDVSVLDATTRIRWLRGNFLYLYAALSGLVGYPGLEISVGDAPRRTHLMLVIANARHFGGVFTIAPAASVTDARLDAISIFDLPLHRRVALLAAATRGTHVRSASVTSVPGEDFLIGFAEPPAYQADGELYHARSRSVAVRCLPGALRVLTADTGLPADAVTSG